MNSQSAHLFVNSGNVFPLHHQITHVQSASDAWEMEWGSLQPCYPSSYVLVPWKGNECGPAHAVDEDDHEPHHVKTPFEQLDLAEGELPSIGSNLHATGECKRCAFFSKGRCQNGKECSHCHFPHDERRRRKNRRGKAGNSDDIENVAAQANLSAAEKGMTTRANVQSFPSSLPPKTATGSVSLPTQSQGHHFDSTIVFGTITPETQLAVRTGFFVQEEESGHISESDEEAPAFSSIFGKTDEASTSSTGHFSDQGSKAQVVLDEDEEKISVKAKGFSKVADEEIKCTPTKAFISPGTPSIKSPDLVLLEKQMIEAEEEAARLEADAISAEQELERTANGSHLTAEEDDSKLATVAELDTTTDSEEGSRDSAELLSSESDGGNTSTHNTSSSSREKVSPKEQGPPKQGRRLHSPMWPSRAPVEEIEESPSSSDEVAKESQAPPKSWASQHKRSRENGPEDGVGAVKRRARGLLNKLTETNFDTVYQQLLECGIHTKAQLEAVVMEIFEKATTQHTFLRMYVELAAKMDQHFKKDPVEGCDFRKILVGACQRTFENNLKVAVPVNAEMSYEEQYEAQVKFKTRMLGNLRFVGELLVRKLLVGKILLAVAEELLSMGDGASIEAAVTLLETAGPSFDRDSWVFVPRLRAIFSMMRPISTEPAVPMRVKCLVKDLLEYRDRGWCAKAAPNIPTVMPSRKF